MKEGDVVLTPIPQADGTIKNRPAVVLREMPRYRDLLICGVSTQLHQRVDGFDENWAGGFRLRNKRIADRVAHKARISSHAATKEYSR